MDVQAKLDAVLAEKAVVLQAGNEATARVQQLAERMHQLAGAEKALTELLGEKSSGLESP